MHTPHSRALRSRTSHTLLAAACAALLSLPTFAHGQDDEAQRQARQPETVEAGAVAAKGVVSTDQVVLSFFPQDSNDTATVVFLYNATTSDADVDFQMLTDTGSPCESSTVTVPAGGTVRLSSDSLVAGEPPSWSNTQSLATNDTCLAGRVTLPHPDVHIDGYIAWSGGSISYDPRAQWPRLPLRFTVVSP